MFLITFLLYFKDLLFVVLSSQINNLKINTQYDTRHFEQYMYLLPYICVIFKLYESVKKLL